MKTPLKPVSGLIAGLVENLTRLFGAAPRRQFTEKDLAGLNLAEPFNRSRIVAAVLNGNNPFDSDTMDRVRKLIAENADDNVKLEAACDHKIKAAYREDPGGLDAPSLQQRYEKAIDVRRAIKRRLRARQQEMGELLKPGLLAVAEAVDKAALGLLEAEAAAANHFGLAFSPSSLVRAMATAGRTIRSNAEGGIAAPDICGMTCGLVTK